jgi:hypothetical protein
MARISSKYFIGDSLPHKWSSVYNYKPQSPEIFATKGEVYAVFNLYAAEGFNATTAGNLLVDQFHETYFESKKESILEAVESALLAVSDRLKELLANEDEAAESGVDLDAVVMIVRGEELYFISLGENKILVLPAHDYSEPIDITASLRDPYGKGMIKTGSSFSQPEQRFLLATKNVLQELKKEEIKDVLSSFSDLRIKNHDYKAPEEIACFIVGVDVSKRKDAEEESGIMSRLTGNPELEELQEQEPEVEPEQILETETESQSQSELEPELSAESELPDQEGMSLSERRKLAADPAAEQEFAEPEQGAEQLPEQSEVAQTPMEQMRAGALLVLEKLKQLPIKARAAIKNWQSQREINRLQAQRSAAAVAPGAAGDSYSRRPHNSRVDTSNMTTAQAMLAVGKSKFNNFKDVLLYDVLKVNQRRMFAAERGFDGKLAITIAGVRLQQNVLLIIGVVVLLFVAYGVISNIGVQRERSNMVIAATERLAGIKREITDIEASPVLNARSFADIPQREELLTTLTTLEGKASDELLNVLTGDEVNQVREKLKSLRNQVLKIKKPQLNILFDAGNSFHGGISDIAKTGENIYAVDAGSGKLYRQPINGGTPELVVEGLLSPTALAADSNGELAVYTASGSSVITMVNPVTKQSSAVPGISTDKLPRAQSLAIYDATNALYAVSAGDSRIYQMSRVGKNYALPTIRYNEPAAAAVNDVAIIQRQVFALVSGKGIVRLASESARLDAFQDVINSVSQARVFGYDADYIYVADEANKRLLIFTINRGSQPISDFVAQVDLGAVGGSITGVTADPNRNLVFVSDSSKIYTFRRSEALN